MNNLPLLMLTPAGYLFLGCIALSLWLSYKWQSSNKNGAQKPGCISVVIAGAVISLFLMFPTMVSWQFFEHGTTQIRIGIGVLWVLIIGAIFYFVKSRNYKLLGSIFIKLLMVIFGALFLVLVGGMAYFVYLRLFTHEKDDTPVWATYICIFFLAILTIILFGYIFDRKPDNGNQKTEFDDLEEAKLNAPFVEVLNLSGQQLTSLPNDILKFKNLKTLDISNNLITELPNDMNKMSKLLCIKLSNNPISDQQRAVIRKMFTPEMDIIFRS